MATLSSSNVATAIVKLIAADILPLLFERLTLGNIVKRGFEPYLAALGDTVNVPIPSLDGCLGNAQIVLDKHREANFVVPDIMRVLAIPELLKVYLEPAVNAISEVLEVGLFGLSGRFSNPVIGAPSQPLIAATVNEVETALFLARVPAAAMKYLVVDGLSFNACRAMPHFAEYESASDAGMRAWVSGPIGRIKGVWILRSPFVAKSVSKPSFIPATHNIAFASDALGLITRRLPLPLDSRVICEYAEVGDFGIRVTMPYNPASLAQSFSIDILYGCGVLRASSGVEVIT